MAASRRASEEVEELWEGWDPDSGYSYKYQYEPEVEKLPRRTSAAGLHQGLSLLLTVERDEYYCSDSESVGFKVSFIVKRTYIVLNY